MRRMVVVMVATSKGRSGNIEEEEEGEKESGGERERDFISMQILR